MNIRKWLSDNARPIEGLVGILLILGMLIGAAPAVWRALGSDLVVKFELHESTVPPEVMDAIGRVMTAAHKFPDSKSSCRQLSLSEEDVLNVVRSLRSSDTLKRFSLFAAERYPSGKIDALTVVIQNKSDHVVSKVRLRITSAFLVLTAGLAGNFLTDQERQDFQSRISYNQSSDFVLPELPPIPPKAILVLIVRGDLNELTRPEVSSDVAVRTIQILKVEDSWTARMATNKRNAVFWGINLMLLIVLLILVISQAIAASLTRQARPRICYELAVDSARQGNSGDATAFLQAAVSEGFKDEQAILNEPVFGRLSGDERFETILAQLRSNST